MPEAREYNSIFSTDTLDTDAYHVGFNNQSGYMLGNAYYNWPLDSGQVRGYDTDNYRVDLTGEPEAGTSYPELLTPGYTGIILSHDINGKPRTVSTPDIGPIDFSS